MTELRIETLTLPGARLGSENPLPFFRDPILHREIPVLASVPPVKREHLGEDTGFRVLPYRMQDQYSRRHESILFRSVVLENELLRATFLPELGGRLISLFDRQQNRELLHCNPVFQPANLAIRNAWFSGGVEWNIGQYGHTFSTCSPIFASAIAGPRGEPGLRLYEYERCKGLFWQIDFTLPSGQSFLIAYTRVINPAEIPTSMYWWTNIAIDERPRLRVLSPAQSALYAAMDGTEFHLGYTQLPGLPSLNGADGTYSLHSSFANEFFFQCDPAEMPWEAAVDEHGSGLVEASTARLKYRKLFCWGTHTGGRHWQEFLSQPGQAYLEIQAGLAPTQIHGLSMPGRTTWDWTQVFGPLHCDPSEAHSSDWDTAIQAVDCALKAVLAPEQLYAIEQECRERAGWPSDILIQTGAGWGALELRRRGIKHFDLLSPALWFPEKSLGPEQARWISLLDRGYLPDQDPAELPGEWMVQAEWEALLEESLNHAGGRNWFALLHLGVMRMERFDEPGARAAWLESLALTPSPWAYRNLAVLSQRQNDLPSAFAWYEKAWQTAQQLEIRPASLAIEYMQVLADAGEFERGLAVYRSLPSAVQDSDRIQILRGRCAIAVGDLDAVDQVLEREYAVVREGENVLTDLWFERSAIREAAQSGRSLDDDLRQEIKQYCVPPRRLDFRMVSG